MIVGVRGILEAIGPDWVYVQIGGVTLQVFVPSATIGELGSIGDTVKLHTHLRFRDEQPVLYGFTSLSASELFVSLNSVSGIGPRLSLALLSSLGVEKAHQAIASEDIAALSSAPGVGRRTAGRIVLELKGKLEAEIPGVLTPQSSGDSEVIAALTALGYSPNEARQAVENVDKNPDLTVDERIRMALQRFGSTG